MNPKLEWSTKEKLSLSSYVLQSGNQHWSGGVTRMLRSLGEPNRPPDWFSAKNCAQQYTDLIEAAETPRRKRGERSESNESSSSASSPATLSIGDAIVRKLTQERIEEIRKQIRSERAKYKKLKNTLAQIESGDLDDKLDEMIEEIQRKKAEEAQTKTPEAKNNEEVQPVQEVENQNVVMETSKPDTADDNTTTSEEIQPIPVPENSEQDSETLTIPDDTQELKENQVEMEVDANQEESQDSETIEDSEMLPFEPTVNAEDSTEAATVCVPENKDQSQPPCEETATNVTELQELTDTATTGDPLPKEEDSVSKPVIVDNINDEEPTANSPVCDVPAQEPETTNPDVDEDVQDVLPSPDVDLPTDETRTGTVESEETTQGENDQVVNTETKNFVAPLPDTLEKKGDTKVPTASAQEHTVVVQENPNVVASDFVDTTDKNQDIVTETAEEPADAPSVTEDNKVEESVVEDDNISHASNSVIGDGNFSEQNEGDTGSMASTPAYIDSFPSSPALSTTSDADPEATANFRAWKKSIMILWKQVASHRYASLFLQPVTDDIAPNYSNVVYRAMDLSTLKKHLETGVVRTTSEFQRDLMLMFQNALMYNNREHDVYKMALDMQKDVMDQVAQFLATQLMMETAQQSTPKGLRRSTLRKSAMSEKRDGEPNKVSASADMLIALLVSEARSKRTAAIEGEMKFMKKKPPHE
uniref:Bromodomain-containing protein 8 n=1 Tax=Phallusia mammillata TaxID=59560 RepID=A0A6F9D8C9_9ASCI|nr:bromodomain-containing protein 8 [Phallusia mammillata]